MRASPNSMATLSPRPSATLRSTKYVATLKSCGIDVAEIDCSLTSVAAIAHIPPQWARWLLLYPLRQPYARAQRRPPAQSGGDVVESAGLWRAPLALGALRPQPVRPVGATRALWRGHHAHDEPGATRGPLHAARGLAAARIPATAAAVRTSARTRRCRLAERLRLVQHRPDGLLQRLFPQDTSAESHRLRGWILRGGVLSAGRRRQRPRPARPDRRRRAQRLLPQRQLRLRTHRRKRIGRGSPAQPSPGAAQAIARLRLPGACPPRRALRCGRADRDQHR